MYDQELEKLNQRIKNTGLEELDFATIEQYFSVLSPVIGRVFHEICEAKDEAEQIKILQSIFPLQYWLMGIYLVRNVTLPDALWEIANDFDNDDPQTYPYLLRKILGGEYMLQRTCQETYLNGPM